MRRRSEQQHPPTPETQHVRAQGKGETWAAAEQSSTRSGLHAAMRGAEASVSGSVTGMATSLVTYM